MTFGDKWHGSTSGRWRDAATWPAERLVPPTILDRTASGLSAVRLVGDVAAQSGEVPFERGGHDGLCVRLDVAEGPGDAVVVVGRHRGEDASDGAFGQRDLVDVATPDIDRLAVCSDGDGVPSEQAPAPLSAGRPAGDAASKLLRPRLVARAARPAFSSAERNRSARTWSKTAR